MLAALTGCSREYSGDVAPHGANKAESTSTTSGLQGPGTTLRDGFEVPTGTKLVGEVFPNLAHAPYDRPGWSTLLEVDGDPIDAWDAVAAQARTLGYPFASSLLACYWWPLDQAAVAPLGQGEPADKTPNSARNDVPQQPPRLTDLRSTEPEVLFCDETSTARVPAEHVLPGAAVTLSAELRWGEGGARLYLAIRGADAPDESDRSFAGQGADPSAIAQPAPSSVHQLLPGSGARRGQVGEPLGTENDCFEKGYERLVVPKGTQVLADAWGIARDFTAVVAVDDAQAFFDDIGRQLDGAPGGDGELTISRKPTFDGTKVLAFANSVSGGGGGCTGQASADGRYVVFHSYSD